MNSKIVIFSIQGNQFKIQHLIIISVLALSFSTSFLLRSLPSDYGWELNEFDPFFNYRATEYIVENGIEKYFTWNDDLSWYPYGRDVSSNSQVSLHIITAISYWIFGGEGSLYDFTIIFPAVVGSLTSIVLFALVRVIAGTNSALLSSLLFSISLPILVRGQIGWFKSEPLGIFLGILTIYLLLSGLKKSNYKINITKILFSGLFFILAISSWGGNLFFIFPISILIISLPFVRNDQKFFVSMIGIFTTSSLISSLMFERLSTNFFSGLPGLILVVSSLIMISIVIIQKFSPHNKKSLYSSFFIFSILIFSIILFSQSDIIDIVNLPTHRYLNAIFPILTTTDPLTDSVSEHATLYISQSFQFHLVLMIYASMGVWLIFSQTNFGLNISNDMKIFVLVLGLFGVYIGSAFMRLEVFTAISIIILASIGIISIINKANSFRIKNKFSSKIFYILCIGIMLFLLSSLFLPESGNVLAIGTSVPPTITNGGTEFDLGTNDWRNALEWIRDNTDKKSVIGSWWDYGYWIQTIAQRPTLADNSTVIDHRIKSIAKIFFQSPEDAWNELKSMETDYFVIFIAGEKLPVKTQDNESLYILGGGGDESKKYWFGKIAEINLSDYLHPDTVSGTDLFWDETFLGKVTPFELVGYVNFSSDQISEVYIPNWTGVYTFKNKFENSNSQFKLVYQSEGISIENTDKFLGIFIYELLEE